MTTLLVPAEETDDDNSTMQLLVGVDIEGNIVVQIPLVGHDAVYVFKITPDQAMQLGTCFIDCSATGAAIKENPASGIGDCVGSA